MSYELRPYQVEAIAEARRRVAAGARRLLLVSPTGSGKTILFSEVARSAASKGSRVLVLAHRKELIDQTSRKLSAFGVEHGIIMAGVRPAPQRGVQVASVQTLIRRRHAMPQCDLVVIDEAHHSSADSYVSICGWYPSARVLGVTATPWRGDGVGLADREQPFYFDDHIVVAKPAQLRDQGWLVPVRAFEYRMLETKGLKTRGGDYVVDGEVERRATDAGLVGNVVDEWLAHSADRLTVVFAVNVNHSLVLAARFAQAGVAVEHVDGETRKDVRDAIFDRVRRGVTRVLCNCMIATEGLDIPELACAVLARPTKNLGLALQIVGRVLRTADGKTEARIHDHAGVLREHGHPYDDRDYSPERNSHDVDEESRQAAERARGPRLCKTCFAELVLDSEGKCAACGTPYLPGEVEVAERVEVEEGGKRRSHGRTPWSKVDRQSSWAGKTQRDKIFILSSLMRKHGTVKAKRVYHWMSGETEWPSVEVYDVALGIWASKQEAEVDG